MYEIRFLGRGGQGAVVASTVLASSFFKEGKFVQAFPSFGAERRGAPVLAFTRVSEKHIRERFGIYEPDCLIILDASLVRRPDVVSGLKTGQWIVINSDRRPEEFDFPGRFRIATLDANAISLKYGLGSASVPIVNTTILGAFSKATGTVSIQSVVDSILEYAPYQPENNAKAAREAYDSVVC